MKILIAFFDLNNPGGIINNQEALYSGLVELGHSVQVRNLYWKTGLHRAPRTRRALEQQESVMGTTYDQQVGWRWPDSMRFAYKGKSNIARWKEYASKFDLIIWQIPCPTMRKEERGNSDWPELYNVPVKQIIYIHDGNMVDSYPWIYQVVPHLTAAMGVHVCAYNSLANLPLPRAMAHSGQMNIGERIALADSSTNRNGWCSFQTFKGWKHVDDIVRAVPYMENSYRKVLGGGGIHYYYMTSKDKVKDEYLVNRKKDPDALPSLYGKRIWELALEAGMQYVGYQGNELRDLYIRRSKFLIDPSWSKLFSKQGDHYNRTMVEGIISGAAPIGRSWGTVASETGQGVLFKAGVHFVMIPHKTTPRKFAQMVDDAIHMPEHERRQMVEEGREIVREHFDYLKVAQAFIDLAEGRPAGVFQMPDDRGQEHPQMKAASAQAMATFFSRPVMQTAAE